jgi:hypothetical protein
MYIFRQRRSLSRDSSSHYQRTLRCGKTLSNSFTEIYSISQSHLLSQTNPQSTDSVGFIETSILNFLNSTETFSNEFALRYPPSSLTSARSSLLQA